MHYSGHRAEFGVRIGGRRGLHAPPAGFAQSVLAHLLLSAISDGRAACRGR
jgi:hypothetical protein